MANLPGWPITAFMLIGSLSILGWYWGCVALNAWRRRRAPKHPNGDLT